MNIGFFLAEGKSTVSYVLADAMVRSARAHMPDVKIVQLSDEHSSALYGVDVVARREGKNMMRLRLEHYAAEGEWLFLDTDLLVQGDVRHVFAEPFDIAIADRMGSVLPAEVGGDFMRRMPHNLGVVFSRCPDFWKIALQRWTQYPENLQNDIVSDQLAVCETIRERGFNVRILPGIPYNLSPMDERQDTKEAHLVHYKGQRKFWMLRKLYNELGLAI